MAGSMPVGRDHTYDAPMFIETLGAARDMGRLNTILGVLIRHGFGDSVRRLGLADRLERAGHALRWDSAADLARLEPAVQVRLALEELGPTFVKLGQILAGRPDLFGPELIAELEKLHSHVPAVPIERVRPQLREDLGGEPETVFARFEPSRRATSRSRTTFSTEPLVAAWRQTCRRRVRSDRTDRGTCRDRWRSGVGRDTGDSEERPRGADRADPSCQRRECLGGSRHFGTTPVPRRRGGRRARRP